jgi:Ca-activated chloride channel family protein
MVFVVACLFLGLHCPGFARAQEKAPVHIVANVDLVQIPVVIFDDKGAVASGLKKSDFRLFDDGIEQRILYFERERVAVSFVVLADLSSSMTSKIPFVQEAALSLLDAPAGENTNPDEYSFVGVGKRSRQLLPFTNDQRDLVRQVPLLLTATGESTALFDGVWLGAATARREASNKHRAMIIITDGGDNHSRYTLAQTRKLLEEADFPVFAVMAGPSFEWPSIFLPEQRKRTPFHLGKQPDSDLANTIRRDNYVGPAERRGPHNMKALTEVTGGGVFTAREEEDLPRIVRTIGLAVRYRYVLTYKPDHDLGSPGTRQNDGGDHNLHKVRLELYPKDSFKAYSLPYYKRGYRSSE